MRKRNGFTLIELLVAATILGILAVFATSQYRNSVAEARLAKARSQAEQVANAVQRAKDDYPSIRFSASALGNPASGGVCGYHTYIFNPYNLLDPSSLITCNYLDRSDWSNAYVSFHVCADQSTVSSNCPTERALVCFQVKNDAKLPANYLGQSWCVPS